MKMVGYRTDILINIKIAMLSFIIAWSFYLLQGNIGIDFSTEGFLWYGTIQTLNNKIPLLDFQSYDPGRYYWCSLWCKILDPGIMSLRFALMLIQALGLFFGLSIINKFRNSWNFLFFSGIIMFLWMFPRHKAFECSYATGAIFFAVFLLENPSLKRHFIAGVFVGLSAFFGRNLGLYSFLSFSILIFYNYFKLKEKFLSNLFSWCTGILVGFMPILLMVIIIPNFFHAYIEIIIDIWRFGHTNMPIQVVWPWNLSYLGNHNLRSFLISVHYIVIPLFYLLIFLLQFIKNLNSNAKNTMTALALVGIIFLHYPFSCPDFPHLSQAIQPFIMGLLIIPIIFNYKKYFFYAHFFIIVTVTFLMVGFMQPYYQALASKGDFLEYNVDGDQLMLDKSKQNIIEIIQQINTEFIKNDNLLFIPEWSGLYVILNKKAPLWNLYFIIPETEQRQKEMIAELKKKNIKWIIIGDVFFGGLEKLRLKHTHTILTKFFLEEYKPVLFQGLPSNYKLLKKHRPDGKNN